KRNRIILAALLLLAISFQGRDPKSPKTVSISMSGAFALYPLAQVWAQEYNKNHPDIRFDIQAGGAGKGFTDCMSGAVDVGMFSREFSEAEKKRGVWYIAVCKDAVLPTLNLKNPNMKAIQVRGIKKAEFQSI